jgi:DUF4097 and DUF4098 domain-containing protein YvlB
MKFAPRLLILAALSAGLCAAARAQEAQGSRVVAPLGDPARPAQIRVDLAGGSITVVGYDGKEVVVEARASQRENKNPPEARKFEISAPSLRVSEENNVVRVHVGAARQPLELAIRAPFASSLKLKCENGGEISADGVEGEIEVESINGGIVLRNVSGPVLAHTINGGINAVMTKVPPDKPMSFSVLNGNINVTLPPDTKANVRLDAQNGVIRTDFEIKHADDSPPRPRHGGPEKSVRGTLNGGGAEIRLKTLNGNIHLLRGKP